MKTKILLAGLFSALGFTPLLHGQRATVASGGSAAGAGGSVEYSVGQIDYLYSSGTTGLVSQGVQQPYEISEATGLANSSITLEMVVYPNPTLEDLEIRVKGNQYIDLNYALYSIDGKILQFRNSILSEVTTLSLREYAKGAYLLSVFSQNELVKSFNIIKN